MSAANEVGASQVHLSPARATPRRSSFRRREMIWGYAFLAPWIVGFFLFQLLPIVTTIFLSFTDYTGTKQFALGNFTMVGLANYQKLFTDIYALPAMGVTLKYALIGVPLGLAIPLAFAVLVNSRYLFGANFVRPLFFLPTVIPVVAGTIIFGGVLNAQTGWINLLLKAIGLVSPPRWLTDPVWSVPSLNLLGIWAVGNAMLILLASLQGVPMELYEAATIDGANASQKFFRITLALISPVIFYNITLGIIGAFQYFVPAMLLGGLTGDPQRSLYFFPLHFYREAFVFSNMGYGSVLALVLFIITMIATGLLFFVIQRRVYYAGS